MGDWSIFIQIAGGVATAGLTALLLRRSQMEASKQVAFEIRARERTEAAAAEALRLFFALYQRAKQVRSAHSRNRNYTFILGTLRDEMDEAMAWFPDKVHHAPLLREVFRDKNDLGNLRVQWEEMRASAGTKKGEGDAGKMLDSDEVEPILQQVVNWASTRCIECYKFLYQPKNDPTMEEIAEVLGGK